MNVFQITTYIVSFLIVSTYIINFNSIDEFCKDNPIYHAMFMGICLGCIFMTLAVYTLFTGAFLATLIYVLLCIGSFKVSYICGQ